MTRFNALRPRLAAAGFALGALLSAGCGRMAPLEAPGPLFGQQAQADDDARRAAREAAKVLDAARKKAADGRATETDPDADNAPKTRRQVRSPEQDNRPIREEPIPGSNDLVGPPPSMRPPGAR